MIRSAFRELRAILGVLWWILVLFALVFLAGALVGTFFAGLFSIANMAPSP